MDIAIANRSTGDHDAAHRPSWSPQPNPQLHNIDEDPHSTSPLDPSYINDRFQPHRTIYPETPKLDSASRGQPPRKKRHLESSDVDSTNQDEQSHKGPYFDAIRNTFTSSQNPAVSLSQESLRALDSRPGESSGRVQGWLQGPTQFSVDTHRKTKHSVEYMLQEDARRAAVPAIPMLPTPNSRPQHECVNCKRSFNTKSELRHHARRYEKRPYNCEQCDKSFLYPKDLRRHATTHTGSKQYRCLSCPKAFSRKDNLRRHMSNEHGHEEGLYEEVVEPAVNQRDQEPEPDQDSQDRIDHEPHQSNTNGGVSYIRGQDAMPQSANEDRSVNVSGSGEQQETQQSERSRECPYEKQNQDEITRQVAILASNLSRDEENQIPQSQTEDTVSMVSSKLENQSLSITKPNGHDEQRQKDVKDADGWISESATKEYETLAPWARA